MKLTGGLVELIQKLIKNGLNVKLLQGTDLLELQAFLDLSQDFFVLCEGEKGLAQKVLADCPASKNPFQNKFVLGAYENDYLFALIDLIQNYPEEGTWTLGYLLIHPSYRSQRKGYSVVEGLASALSQLQGKKMRCVVQEQNPRALNFWTRCGFIRVKTLQEEVGSFKNNTYVLERKL